MSKMYCWPNRYGFVGFALFLVMLAAGGTFQNNLVFIMAFVCLSFAMVAILQTARNLRDIKILSLYVEPKHSGERTTATLTVQNLSSQLKLGLEMRVDWKGQPLHFTVDEILPHGVGVAKIGFDLTLPRGVYSPRRVQMKTSYPYGLFNAWTYHRSQDEILIYPKPQGQDLKAFATLASGEDFSGHKLYTSGDNFRRVDWKVFSKTKHLYIKEFNEANDNQCLIAWSEAPQTDFESKLSQLSLWIHQAEQKKLRYEVHLPRFQSPSLQGAHHYQSCMTALTRLAA